MVEPGDDHTDSQHSVDDLFQLLVHARGVLPDTKAKGEILSALQRGDLQVDFHIRGGARSVRLIAPPEGITGRVHRESWEPGRVFSLTIKDDRLNVLPNCALDHPWTDYSFTIANWWMVDELWPLKPPAPTSPAVLLTREVTLTVADWPATYDVTPAPTVSESSVEPQADIDAAPPVSSLSTEQTPESPEPPVPRLQEMRRAGLIKGLRQKMAANWALDAYPPDGDIPSELTASEMAEAIQQWRKRQGSARLVDEALRRFCSRFLKAYRKNLVPEGTS